MISREMIVDLFESTRGLRTDGRVSWSIDDPCRWSFFFLDKSREKLIAAGEELEARGYEFVGLLEPGPDEEADAPLYLRCDRIERHTVDSLMQRNDELAAYAAHLGLEAYDGMDVGVADGP
jgi:Regulator of ribonuclease activity B